MKNSSNSATNFSAVRILEFSNSIYLQEKQQFAFKKPRHTPIFIMLIIHIDKTCIHEWIFFEFLRAGRQLNICNDRAWCGSWSSIGRREKHAALCCCCRVIEKMRNGMQLWLRRVNGMLVRLQWPEQERKTFDFQ